MLNAVCYPALPVLHVRLIAVVGSSDRELRLEVSLSQWSDLYVRSLMH